MMFIEGTLDLRFQLQYGSCLRVQTAVRAASMAVDCWPVYLKYRIHRIFSADRLALLENLFLDTDNDFPCSSSNHYPA